MATTARPPLDARPPWVVVINAASGRQEGEAIAGLIRDALTEAGIQGSIRLVSHAEEIPGIAEQAARQARERRGILVGVGGDGTLSAVAAAAVRAGAAFSAVPGGTFNYFGRSHGFPEEPLAAVHSVLQGELRPIQVGQVNGHIFLVNASFGLYPQLLEDREAFKQQWGRSRPAAWGAALLTLLGQHRLHRLHLKVGDQEQAMLASTVFVGNNRLQLEHIGLPEASVVDEGQLLGLILRPMGRLGLVRLAVQGALGRLGGVDEVERVVFRHLTVAPGGWWRRRTVRVAMDGEQFRMRSPLVFDVSPTPLWLLAPGRPMEVAHP
ncbi:diacylglycerol kinase family protein [Zoogloea sp.]|uniref:diacylglycerol/lipid kinase family protein n=1 Tax=Zoogloea sp. TaxID=49181 RepID=UPI0035B42F69